eukprot:CAMPEP_0203974676 /NCGR_PEP_ID=MMETSP0359-20131031/100223_1 /ASSEMBLY_ACC=CAM_ASM_000338 /TAXON_ID=268821 /ORGANISM="Scrippsiella Hangoei, Strain SHTV-5" /LENGTH=138 /DNA_ID=CAMNT_0050912863 /DNA_START=1020 /DNA_END=1436 /DNA_ORIENTATION=-
MSAHGMSVLLRRARARHQSSARSITTGSLARALRSPTRTLCTKARDGDLLRSISGSKLPVCALRSRDSSATRSEGVAARHPDPNQHPSKLYNSMQSRRGNRPIRSCEKPSRSIQESCAKHHAFMGGGMRRVSPVLLTL